MKKVIRFSLIVFLMVFCMSIKAATYECTYTGAPEEYVIEYDTTNGTYNNKNENNKPNFSYEYTYYAGEIKSLKSIEDGNDKNECPILYLDSAVVTVAGLSSTSAYMNYFYSDQYLLHQTDYLNCISSQ